MTLARRAVSTIAIAASTLPMAFVGTFLSMPLWSAIESSTGIESVGHSGPAEWCFLAMWATLFCVAIGGLQLIRRSRARDPSPRR